MHARSKRFDLAPGRRKAAVERFRDHHAKNLKARPGFKSMTLLGNGDRVSSFSVWDADDAADKKAEKDATDDMRNAGGGTGPVSEDEWEVLLDLHP